MRCRSPLLGLLVFVAACGDMGKEPSTLTSPQVLGARANPRAVNFGDTVTMEAITFGVDTLEWFVCYAPYIPDGDPRCSTEPDAPEIPLGTGPTATLTIPDESLFESLGVNVPGVYVRTVATSAEGQQISIATVPFDQTGDHPAITSVTTEDGATPDTDVTASTELMLKPVLDLPDGTGDVLVTWFVERGEADPFRTQNDAAVKILVPADAGPMTVIAVVRDDDFGVGWFETTFTVVP